MSHQARLKLFFCSPNVSLLYFIVFCLVIIVNSQVSTPLICLTTYDDVTVTANECGGVVGSGPFRNDSDIAQAARFLGLMQICQTAVISRTDTGNMTIFYGSSANGVTTADFTEYCGITISLVSIVSPSGGNICYCSGYSGPDCNGCFTGYTLKTVQGVKVCIINQALDNLCIEYSPFSCKRNLCTICPAGYAVKPVIVDIGVVHKCLVDPTQFVRDCNIYQYRSGGGFECYECDPSNPNLGRYPFTTMGILAFRCLHKANEFTNFCKTYSNISSIYECIACQTGYQLTTITIAVGNPIRCLNIATQIMSNCIEYGVDASNKTRCIDCSTDYTVMLISGAYRCLPNYLIDPKCTNYAYTAPNFACTQCTSLFTLSDYFNGTGKRKLCIQTTKLIRDCAVYADLASGGFQCYQCSAITNVVLTVSVFNTVQMKRCLNSVSQIVPECTAYTIQNPYVCSACNSGSTLKPISGIPKCLPNIVIDTQCTTYILNGSNYECSVCTSSYTVSRVLIPQGIYKYCLLTSIIIRDCALYITFMSSYQCRQCETTSGIVLLKSLFDTTQMHRCLSSITQVVPQCTSYIVGNPYYCNSCNSGFTLKPVSGMPKCLPNIVIDPDCTTYILNGSNYECSACISSKTVCEVYESFLVYKYCLPTTILIRDCEVYVQYPGGYQCRKCASFPIKLVDNVYNGNKMQRCLSTLTEYDRHCTSYKLVNLIYSCTECTNDTTLIINSGLPVNDMCLKCEELTFKCKTCLPNLTCTSCEYPYILGSTTGICDKCEAGFQYVDTLCIKPIGCQNFLPDYSRCLACFGKYHFTYNALNNSCVCEVGYKTANVSNKTVCLNQCGDGILSIPQEQCDDKNTRNNDGCDQMCKVQPDFVCNQNSCKLQYRALHLKYNYVYKVEQKNRCRFSFSLEPVHTVFNYVKWQHYLNLNISASNLIVPNTTSYSYTASTNQIFVQFDYQQTLEGMSVQAKFSASNIPVLSSVNQFTSQTNKRFTQQTQNGEFIPVKASSSNQVGLQIISTPAELVAIFKLEGINAQLIYEETGLLKAQKIGSVFSLNIAILILVQFFIGSYVHKMIGLETSQILQFVYFARVIVQQKISQFLQSMNSLKYAAIGGYSNYVFLYHTTSSEAINLSSANMDKKFLSAGLMKFYTLNVNLPLILPIAALLYYAFKLIKKFLKRNHYLQTRQKQLIDQYTMVRRQSQWVYDHFVFPLINLFNFVAFFCTIIYLEVKSSANASKEQSNVSQQLEIIQSTSFIFLSCTVFITFFIYCYEIFNSYEQVINSRLTSQERACIPQSLIQKLQHDSNNPDKPNYKPGYILVYLFYYLIVQIIIMTGVFFGEKQMDISCEILACFNFFYLIVIWKWKPYCVNVNLHNKILVLNHLTSLIFLLVCISMNLTQGIPMIWVTLFYLVFALLVIVGICGFIRIYLEYRFRVKMKEDTTILQFDKQKFLNKNKNPKIEQNKQIKQLKIKQKYLLNNPFIFQNQIRQYNLHYKLPEVQICQDNNISHRNKIYKELSQKKASRSMFVKDIDKKQDLRIFSQFDPLGTDSKQQIPPFKSSQKFLCKELPKKSNKNTLSSSQNEDNFSQKNNKKNKQIHKIKQDH